VRPPRSRPGPRTSAALVAALAALAPASCSEVESETAAGYEPSKLVDGRVQFTAEAAERTGIRTGLVRRAGARVSVPYKALLYDAEGKTYVYTSPRALRYRREEVRVVRIERDRVVLSHGPALGTRVGTVGAAEVYGTELEVAAK
jgi:hypothetical protein